MLSAWLDKLPDNVVDHIASCCHPYDRISLSLSCKALRAAAAASVTKISITQELGRDWQKNRQHLCRLAAQWGSVAQLNVSICWGQLHRDYEDMCAEEGNEERRGFLNHTQPEGVLHACKQAHDLLGVKLASVVHHWPQLTSVDIPCNEQLLAALLSCCRLERITLQAEELLVYYTDHMPKLANPYKQAHASSQILACVKLLARCHTLKALRIRQDNRECEEDCIQQLQELQKLTVLTQLKELRLECDRSFACIGMERAASEQEVLREMVTAARSFTALEYLSISVVGDKRPLPVLDLGNMPSLKRLEMCLLPSS